MEEAEDMDEKIKLERFVSDIDYRLDIIISKMISCGIRYLEPTVKHDATNEDEIKEFVRDLIFADEDPSSKDVYSEDELKFNFIRRTKCSLSHAENVIRKMNSDGLNLCEKSRRKTNYSLFTNDFSRTYNLGKFANLRGYLTIKELGSVLFKRAEARQEMEREDKEREEKYIAKYGPDKSKWSEDVKEKYEDFEEL